MSEKPAGYAALKQFGPGGHVNSPQEGQRYTSPVPVNGSVSDHFPPGGKQAPPPMRVVQLNIKYTVPLGASTSFGFQVPVMGDNTWSTSLTVPPSSVTLTAQYLNNNATVGDPETIDFTVNS